MGRAGIRQGAGTAAILLAILAPAGVAAAGPAAMPVIVGGDAEMDACAASGAVAGLDPKGDNYLSVRSGPGGAAYREVDRIGPGRRITICAERKPWLGIVYAPAGRAVDCGLSSPQPRAAPYRGPCRSGWVHRRYVRVTAG